jgi:peptidyl-prolyl cis-trans isomerase D
MRFQAGKRKNYCIFAGDCLTFVLVSKNNQPPQKESFENMLDFVRNQQKSIIIKIAFGIIILSFVIGYAMLSAPGGPGDERQESIAATVNDTAIAYSDFQAAYSNLYQLYQSIYQDQFNPALERQLKLAEKAINGLVDQSLLLEEAERLEYQISKKEMVEAIAKVQAFQQDGQFSKDRYLQVLAYQRLKPEQFEEMQRRELLVEKVRQQLQQGVTVEESDIETEFREQNEKVNLDFVRLSGALFENKVKVDDEGLAAFFSERQEIFRVDEKVSLRYLQFTPGRYSDSVTFDDAEIDKYYRRHLDQFDVPEQVDAAHILIKVGSDADDKDREKKKAFAEKLLADARAEKDFAELARTYSDDTASAVKGGDLGFFTRGTMVPAFEKTAFALKPGEISELVETPFGYHIIKAKAYIEPGVKPLDEAIDDVKAGLRAEKANQIAFEKAMDAYNINRKTGDLQAAADANDIGIKETGLFAQGDAIDGFGRNEEVTQAAFALADNTLARPIITDDGVVLLTLKERIPSYIPELDEVRDLVIADYRAVKAKDLAKEAAEKMLDDMRVGGKIAKLADRAGQSVEETGMFASTYSPFVPRIGTSEELLTAAFALPEDQTVIDQVFEVQGRYVVASVKGREAADMSLIDEEKRKELNDSLLTRKQNDAVQERIDALRASSTIQITPQVQAVLDQENQP